MEPMRIWVHISEVQEDSLTDGKFLMENTSKKSSTSGETSFIAWFLLPTRELNLQNWEEMVDLGLMNSSYHLILDLVEFMAIMII